MGEQDASGLSAPGADAEHYDNWPIAVLDIISKRYYEMVADTHTVGHLIALASGFLALIWSEVFGAMSVMYGVAMAFDWVLGRQIAEQESCFSAEKALKRTLGKVTGYGLILLLFIAERRVADELEFFVQGGVGATVAMGLYLLDEFDSVETNRLRLGFNPIPLWTPLIGRLRGAVRAVAPMGETPHDEDEVWVEENDPERR